MKMSLEEALADNKNEIQTFKKADEKAKIIETVEANKKEVGRPKILNDKDKSKKRILYYSDNEFEIIEKMANLYNMKPMKWIKMIVQKEINKELLR